MDSSKAKEIYDNLHNAVKELLNSPVRIRIVFFILIVTDNFKVKLSLITAYYLVEITSFLR